MVFITAGMGGGTGTGAAPVIARAAREQRHPDRRRGDQALPLRGRAPHARWPSSGIEELQQYVDTLIIIPNQNLFRIANERTTFADAFKMADDVLHTGVRGVTDLMVMPGLINLDFADIRTVMSEMGKAMMGTGEAEGERRAIDAAEAAITNPLLEDVSMKGARGVLINITGGPDMTLFEVDEAANRIREEVDPDANIIFGSTFDEGLEGQHARLGRRDRHRQRGRTSAGSGGSCCSTAAGLGAGAAAAEPIAGVSLPAAKPGSGRREPGADLAAHLPAGRGAARLPSSAGDRGARRGADRGRGRFSGRHGRRRRSLAGAKLAVPGHAEGIRLRPARCGSAAAGRPAHRDPGEPGAGDHGLAAGRDRRDSGLPEEGAGARLSLNGRLSVPL